jgi:hypothetical protein
MDRFDNRYVQVLDLRTAFNHFSITSSLYWSYLIFWVGQVGGSNTWLAPTPSPWLRPRRAEACSQREPGRPWRLDWLWLRRVMLARALRGGGLISVGEWALEKLAKWVARREKTEIERASPI